MPNIRVTDYTHEELKRIKEAEDHTNFDSVLRALVGSYEVS